MVSETTRKLGKSAGNRGLGRPKGSRNKNTALLKDAVMMAAEAAGGRAGLVGYLTRQAKENPGPFLSLLGRVLPLQLSGTLHHEHTTKEQRDAAVVAFERAIEADRAVN